jgi:hypothetical protein
MRGTQSFLTQRSAKYIAEERQEDGGSLGVFNQIEKCYLAIGSFSITALVALP